MNIFTKSKHTNSKTHTHRKEFGDGIEKYEIFKP